MTKNLSLHSLVTMTSIVIILGIITSTTNNFVLGANTIRQHHSSILRCDTSSRCSNNPLRGSPSNDAEILGSTDSSIGQNNEQADACHNFSDCSNTGSNTLGIGLSNGVGGEQNLRQVNNCDSTLFCIQRGENTGFVALGSDSHLTQGSSQENNCDSAFCVSSTNNFFKGIDISASSSDQNIVHSNSCNTRSFCSGFASNDATVSSDSITHVDQSSSSSIECRSAATCSSTSEQKAKIDSGSTD